jgi:hypothetical protein
VARLFGVFENLAQVDLEVERRAVRSVIMAIQHASKVRLAIKSPRSQLHTSMFSNLRHLKNLFDLTILFLGKDLYLDGKDLARLRTLENLEFLSIEREEKYMKDDPTLENFESSILEVVHDLPKLHSFRWQVCWLDLSFEELSVLSDHYPILRSFVLFGAWGLQMLGLIPRRLFRKLQILTLESSVEGGHKDMLAAKEIARQIMRHAPDLEILEIKDDLHSRVLNAWKKLKKQREAGITIDFEETIRPMRSLKSSLKVPLTAEELEIFEASGEFPQDHWRHSVDWTLAPTRLIQ